TQVSGPRIFGKRIRPGAPGQIVVDVAAEGLGERVPGDSLGRAAEGWFGHRRKPGIRDETDHLVPDRRHIAMKHVRIVVQRTVPNLADESIDDRVIDVAGLDTGSAGVARDPPE